MISNKGTFFSIQYVALYLLILIPGVFCHYPFCEDTEDFFEVIVSGSLFKKDCRWVDAKKHQRCDLTGVSAECPVTCDFCQCLNNKNTFLVNSTTFDTGSEIKDCHWVKEDPSLRCSTAFIDTVSNCPLYCGECHQAAPSAIPTIINSNIPSNPSSNPSNKSSSSPSISPHFEVSCPIEEFFGKTFYIQTIMCLKVELFPSGTIAAAYNSYSNCDENTNLTFSTISFFESANGDTALYSKGILGDNGYIANVQTKKVNNSPSTFEMKLTSIESSTNTMNIELRTTFCDAPSLIPSNEPSKVPSMSPSISPSNLPSAESSSNPSTEPSSTPSTTPSMVPTLSPSTSPSLKPTRKLSTKPSLLPSNIPISMPSWKPSLAPSREPSREPSNNPTLKPSTNPTTLPSSVHSWLPSVIPSVSPSLAPSTSPSTGPTNVPSYAPSSKPSLIPSEIPTENPTLTRSTSPSSAPSNKQSFMPSRGPSAKPSSSPSMSPSPIPTSKPSLKPSREQSTKPSLIPSTGPSSVPTIEPSFTSSFSPSGIPSNIPSVNSSTQPSLNLSIHPSSEPTKESSTIPTNLSTSFPSTTPTNLPTIVPCPIDEFIGRDFYFEILLYCIKAEMYEGGSLYVYTSNQGCSTRTAATKNLIRLSSYRKSFDDKADFYSRTGYSGFIRFKVHNEVTDIDLWKMTFDADKKTFDILLKIPGCVSPSLAPIPEPSSVPSITASMTPSDDPSNVPTLVPSWVPSTQPSSEPSSLPTTRPSSIPTLVPTLDWSSNPSSSPTPQERCNIEELFGKTYFMSVTSIGSVVCLSFGLFEGGVLALDSFNPSCTEGSSDPSNAMRVSYFDYASGAIAFFKKGTNGSGWQGQIEFLLGNGSSPRITNILTNLSLKTFSVQVNMPSCISPSDVPSTSPTTAPTPPPSTMPSSPVPTVAPSINPTPVCNVPSPFYIGDSHCDDDLPGYYTAECDWDGGDCDEKRALYPDCPGPFAWIGDCGCDIHLNIIECGFDGGDCVPNQVNNNCEKPREDKVDTKKRFLLLNK